MSSAVQLDHLSEAERRALARRLRKLLAEAQRLAAELDATFSAVARHRPERRTPVRSGRRGKTAQPKSGSAVPVH